MKPRTSRIFLAILLLAGATPQSAFAATPAVSVKPMALLASVDATDTAQGILVKKSSVYLFGTTTSTGSTSDGFVRAFDATGTQMWSLTLDTGGDDIATAAGFDPFGNIWIAGSSALPEYPSEVENIDSVSVVNPDSVTVVPKIPLRRDPNLVTEWLISPTGELISTFQKDVGRTILVKAISINSTTVSVAGVAVTALGSAGFLIQNTRKGVFGKISLIGKRDTEINSVVKAGKNLLLLGSSTETLFGKTRAGARDAISLTYSATGTFTSILRSFNTGAERTWQSGTTGNLLSGDAITGTKIESVVTKFTSNLTPQWSIRFASSGPAVAADSSLTQFVAFPSSSPIVGVKSWKPVKAQLLAVSLDKNGQITGAFSAKGAVSPISVGFSAELGAVVLTRGLTGVSIFHALTR